VTPRSKLQYPTRGNKRQRGQALVFGIFLLFISLLTMFFLFNTGQLTREKTKLVNTADAVAYSGGLLEARALNFDAYTNRAMIANEVAIAQMVSVSSWAQYIGGLPAGMALNYSYYCAEPIGKGMVTTAALCGGTQYASEVIEPTAEAIETAAETVTIASEAFKVILKSAQSFLHAKLAIASRQELMQAVAQANYQNDGTVVVDEALLDDNFSTFTHAYVKDGDKGDERGRIGDVAKAAAYKDNFVRQRSWTDTSLLPTCVDPFSLMNYDHMDRRGGTELLGYDEWKAMDTASHHRWYLVTPGWLEFFIPYCDQYESPLSSGAQEAVNGDEQSGGSYGGSPGDNPVASGMASAGQWSYSGMPEIHDLSADALKEKNPKLRLAVHLTRAKDQVRTSDGASFIKVGGRLAVYNSKPAAGVIAAVSAAEVYFDRPENRGDGKKELGSLFNPFWHVRLAPVSGAIKDTAASLQNAQSIAD
jgi:hypothetical protein